MKFFRKKKKGAKGAKENELLSERSTSTLNLTPVTEGAPAIQTQLAPNPVTVHHVPPLKQQRSNSSSQKQVSAGVESPLQDELKTPPLTGSLNQREVSAGSWNTHSRELSLPSGLGNPPNVDAQRNGITRELVKKFVADIWNRGDLELIPKVCSKSLRFNGSVGMDRVGHEGFARMVTTIRDALNDYHCEIHSMVVEGNKAFCRMRFTGRHTGSLLGYPPSGRQVAWMGAAEFTCKDSLIIKVWELGDVKSLEEQLNSSQ